MQCVILVNVCLKIIGGSLQKQKFVVITPVSACEVIESVPPDRRILDWIASVLLGLLCAGAEL